MNNMRTVFTEAELRGHCDAAGRTCKTEMGCRCAVGQLVGIGNYVQGPTDFGALDNLDNEVEQSMSPPVWLAMGVMLLVGFLLGMLAGWIAQLLGVRL